MQATEAIKLLTGTSQPLCNKLMTLNLLDNRSMILDVPKTLPEKSSFPTSLAEFEAFDYDHHCGTTVSGIQGIDPKEFIEASQNNDTLIRSEEHTSELQSLMRISYAVFCLKKKKSNTNKNTSRKHINT